MIYFVIAILVFCLVGYFFMKMNEWSQSNNSIKQNIGCWVLIIVFVLGFLLFFVGSCKNCANSSSTYDYYEDRAR